MPLPVTPYFEQRLAAVRVVSPEVATLAEHIAAAHKMDGLTPSIEHLTENLFDRIDHVARQNAGCAVRLGYWLYVLYQLGGLDKTQADDFTNRAVALGGQKAAVDHERS